MTLLLWDGQASVMGVGRAWGSRPEAGPSSLDPGGPSGTWPATVGARGLRPRGGAGRWEEELCGETTRVCDVLGATSGNWGFLQRDT